MELYSPKFCRSAIIRNHLKCESSHVETIESFLYFLLINLLLIIIQRIMIFRHPIIIHPTYFYCTDSTLQSGNISTE